MIDVDRLKERLAALKLTPNAASEAAGLGRSYIRDVLRGRIKDPSAWRLGKIADVLETTPAYLLNVPEDHWHNLPAADDRSVERAAEAMAEIEEASRKGSPTNKLMFDLLDSVPDHVMVQMVLSFVSRVLYSEVEHATGLSATQMTVLCGEEESDKTEDFLRRLVVSKGLKLITGKDYAAIVSLAELRDRVCATVDPEIDLTDEAATQILKPTLKREGIGAYSQEVARLFIMSIFAKFLSPNRHGEAKGTSAE